VTVPAGVTSLDAQFQFLSPVQGSEGTIVATPEIVSIEWNTVALYPAGYDIRRIAIQASAVLPEGWQFATALEPAARGGREARFKETDFSTLVDSPLFAGKYFKRFDLDPGAKVPVYLDVLADRPEGIEAKPEQIEAHRALVQQAYKLFGSHHYDHYDFLLAISETFGSIGLEHHQSSENGVPPGYFTEWDKNAGARDLLPHEYTHSWNGKFRRPADLWTANLNLPMQGSLLWVYEGQTEYWGHVLAARSGLVSAAFARNNFANIAAQRVTEAGRTWRNLQDTTNTPVVAMRRGQPWQSWQRSSEYYSEGALIWLDVDSKIREMSQDTRSLNDFARRFFGVDDGSHQSETYTFEDVVAGLNDVEPFGWASFLRARLDGVGSAPLDGLTRSGWKLVFGEERSSYEKDFEEGRHTTGFRYSLGFSLDQDDKISEVQWDGPLFKAGRTVGEKLLAVNGHSYKADLLRSTITAAKSGAAPIELLFKKEDLYTTVRIDYHGGQRYPHLERIEGTPDRLDAIFQPL
jgi:predicted metalloprotease with PDZ domain